ncbi:MAG TPA: hypothetical protein VFX84_02830 [Candidatus Saccharimonadales bacterium]|nr:hypothetical protein [Candidatus Saccharimonadales bacterium]
MTDQTSPPAQEPGSGPEPTPPRPDVEPGPEIPAPQPEDDAAGSAGDGSAITWTASEFIAHDKSFGWYAALGLATAAFAGLVFLVSGDLISVGVVVVAAMLLGSYAGHKPRQMEYRLDAKGLGIGPRHFRYGDFRSFSVIDEGAFSSIVFMPLKRFAAPTTIYYPPEEEDRIVGMLSDRLPMEERGHDAVDRLMHRIRY